MFNKVLFKKSWLSTVTKNNVYCANLICVQFAKHVVKNHGESERCIKQYCKCKLMGKCKNFLSFESLKKLWVRRKVSTVKDINGNLNNK